MMQWKGAVGAPDQRGYSASNRERNMKRPTIRAAFAATFGLVVSTLAWGHDECLVGHDGLGTLHAHEDFMEPLVLDQMFMGFPGIGGAPLGLANLPADEPDIFALPPTVNIGFILTGAHPKLSMWNGLTEMNIDDAYMLGAPFFHFHPVWTLENAEPGVTYSLTGFFRDFNGGFADSEEITMDFSLTPPVCLGDHDGDLTVAFSDITTVLSNFNNPYTFTSITQTLSNFGAACR